MLAVTEPALDPDAVQASQGLSSLLSQLSDQSWASDLGMDISTATSIGVPSLHHESLWALESAVLLGLTRATLITNSRAVARGLGYLRLSVHLGDPADAEIMLLPGLARDAATMWTYRRFAAASWRSTGTLMPVIHPAAYLSPLNRFAFRPPAGVYAIELPRR